MTSLTDALGTALALVLSGDPELMGIIALSLQVSLSAVLIAALLGLPLGALIAVSRFPGRPFVIAILNAAMGLPPVVVGLVIYLLLSRAGPFGEFGLLFTPTAMIVAQALLVTPIIAAVARQSLADMHSEYAEHFRSLGLSRLQTMASLLFDARFALLTAVLAGFGRATAEVGAVLMVGGNIAGVTRVMTTTIALETSRGNLVLALGLGVVLLTITLAITTAAQLLRDRAARRYGA